MSYSFTLLEEYIYELFTKIGIHHPHQLDIEDIANRFGIQVFYLPHKSTYINGVIFLDNRVTDAKRWQAFCHELCHAMLHAGDQLNMPLPFREYQEWKATNFTLHACVPTFMLLDMNLPADNRKAVWMIQEKFGVEREFAEKRLDKWLQNRERQTVYSRMVGF